MNIKIDLSEKLRDWDGSEIQNADTLAKWTTSILRIAKTEEPMKILSLGNEIGKSQSVIVDDADFKVLYDAIRTSPVNDNLVKGQILQVMNTAKIRAEDRAAKERAKDKSKET